MLVREVSQIPSKQPNDRRVVIVGSGAVGLHVANELAKRGVGALVIESGEAHLGSFPSDSYRNIGKAHDGIKNGRSRTIGGTTNLWGGQLVEFQPIDFNGRDWLPGSKWPVSYDQIQPYYQQTYEAFGIPEELRRDDAVWKKVSGQTPKLPGEFEIFLTRWLKIPNFSVMFASTIEQSEKLILLPNHAVVGFEGTGGRIDAVKLLDKDGKPHSIGGDAFVLAAGTIETARLMLHAAQSNDWDCPWRGNQNVGANFQDHLGGRIGRVKPASSKSFFNTFSTLVVSGQKFQPKIRLVNQAMERDQILNIQGVFAFESSVSENLVYLKQFVKAAVFSRKISGIGDFVKNAIACSRYLVPLMWRFVIDHRIFVPESSKISLMMQGEQMPIRQSRITIDPTVKDQWGLPRVVLDWKLNGDELNSAKDFALRIKQAFTDGAIGEIEIEPALLAGDPSFLNSLGDTYHQSGGAMMGCSAEDGVVDANLRVFDTQNLYVGGAATFPTNSNANVTFTALAFATRLAEHLATTKA